MRHDPSSCPYDPQNKASGKRAKVFADNELFKWGLSREAVQATFVFLSFPIFLPWSLWQAINHMIKRCEIWYTDQEQCPDSCHQV